MQSTPHITFEKLTNLADGRLVPDERATCLDHLASCRQCTAKLAELEHVIALMKSDLAEDAPRDLLAYAKNLFATRARTTEPSILKRIVAALTFDSLTVAPQFGVRSGQSPTRQLIFSAEGNDLDLRLTPQGDQWVLAGQVLSPSCAGGQVKMESESASVSASLNQLCEFALPPVAPGKYALRLRLTDIEIEVPQLEI